jgi:hypothetical protein
MHLSIRTDQEARLTVYINSSTSAACNWTGNDSFGATHHFKRNASKNCRDACRLIIYQNLRRLLQILKEKIGVSGAAGMLTIIGAPFVPWNLRQMPGEHSLRGWQMGQTTLRMTGRFYVVIKNDGVGVGTLIWHQRKSRLSLIFR